MSHSRSRCWGRSAHDGQARIADNGHIGCDQLNIEVGTEAGPGRPAGDPRFVWFCRLWAGAALAHIVGNGRNAGIMDSPGLVRISLAILGLFAVLTLLGASDRRLVGGLAAMVVVTAWLEAPFLANHWQLAALVSVVLLVSVTRPDPWGTFAPAARLVTLTFYSLAAFAKLNSDFADPVVSCARHFANQTLGAVGLPGIAASNPLTDATIWATTGIELAVVPLMLFRRTRLAGVTLAMCFHYVISLDLDQHFYDFTAVLLALFSLFLPSRRLERLGGREPTEMQGAVIAGAGMALVLLSVSGSSMGAAGLVRYGAFVMWIPAGALLLWRSLRHGGRDRAGETIWRVGPLGAGVALVVLAIGSFPYLGVRTATAWNMYANLLTYDGMSNHDVVSQAATWRLDSSDFIEILDTDDEALAKYVDSGLRVPAVNVRHYMAGEPEASVRYRDHLGREHTRTGAQWGLRQGALERKLLFSRSTPPSSPVECQATFLVAG